MFFQEVYLPFTEALYSSRATYSARGLINTDRRKWSMREGVNGEMQLVQQTTRETSKNSARGVGSIVELKSNRPTVPALSQIREMKQ